MRAMFQFPLAQQPASQRRATNPFLGTDFGGRLSWQLPPLPWQHPI